MEAPAMDDLETAIEQLVNLGEKDPLDIARKLIERNGETWARLEVAARAQDFIAELARRRLGSVRRSAELALRPGDEISDGHMRIAKVWIPGAGWKVAGDLTVADCLARASWYRNFANAAMRREEWYREVAHLMEDEGAATLKDLKAPLPALPEGELLQISEAS